MRKKLFCKNLEGHWRTKQDLDPDPDLLVRGKDPRIQIQIRIKMLQIPNIDIFLQQNWDLLLLLPHDHALSVRTPKVPCDCVHTDVNEGLPGVLQAGVQGSIHGHFCQQAHNALLVCSLDSKWKIRNNSGKKLVRGEKLQEKTSFFVWFLILFPINPAPSVLIFYVGRDPTTRHCFWNFQEAIMTQVIYSIMTRFDNTVDQTCTVYQ